MLDFYFWHEAKEWLTESRQNIYLLAGVLLVGALAFEGGFLRGKLAQTEPLVVSIPTTQTNTDNTQTNAEKSKTQQNTETQKTEKCAFVGSKNSNKYHLPTCATAKRIKPENKVCFSSKEDAEKKGYIASCMK